MKVLAELSAAGGIENEDLIWHNDRCVAILDGSSGLKGSGFKASKFVSMFISAFSKKIEQGIPLCDAVNESIDEVHIEYTAVTGGNIELPPSAAGFFVYDTGDSLQMLNLGDCAALLFRENSVDEIRSDEVDRFDNKVIQKMIELRQKTGKDICEIFQLEEIQSMLIENRKKMNARDGYRVLSFNMTPVTNSDLLEVKKDGLTNIILYSDGFESQVANMKNRNWDFQTLYHTMRTAEKEDFLLNKVPRFKVSDDASVVLIGL